MESSSTSRLHRDGQHGGAMSDSSDDGHKRVVSR
jgi:hypothetical protein